MYTGCCWAVGGRGGDGGREWVVSKLLEDIMFCQEIYVFVLDTLAPPRGLGGKGRAVNSNGVSAWEEGGGGGLRVQLRIFIASCLLPF